MARTSFLRPLAATLYIVIPLVGACGGHVISLGNTGSSQDQLSSVPPSRVGPSTGACPTGYAHPNVCCSSGPTVAESCGTWEQDPFRACATGSTTYPDPLSCCPLSNPARSACIDTPAPDAANPPPPPPPSYGCGYVCPPGWWSQPASVTPGGPIGPTCCTIVPDSNGVTECESPLNALTSPACGVGVGVGGSGSTGTNGSGPIDAGPPTVDASPAGGGPVPVPTPPPTPPPTPEDAGCPGVDPGYDGGATSLCGECPAGWKADPNQPEVCCTTTSDGTTECFSQATGPVGPIAIDGGVGPNEVDASAPPPVQVPGPSTGWGTAGDGGPGPLCSGTTGGSCSCDETLSGHAYALDCFTDSSGAVQCTCSVDKATKSTFSSTDSSYCGGPSQITAAFTAPTGCNFP